MTFFNPREKPEEIPLRTQSFCCALCEKPLNFSAVIIPNIWQPCLAMRSNPQPFVNLIEHAIFSKLTMTKI